MTEPFAGADIETVHGRLDDATAREITDLWATHGVQIPREQWEARLAQVLCVHRSPAGRIDGVNSANPAPVPSIGNQTLWVYRGLAVGAFDPPMIGAAFAALEKEYSGAGPIGLCVLADAAMQRAHPQLRWQDPPLLHAGFVPDGRQLRVAYFAGAHLALPNSHHGRVSAVTEPPPEVEVIAYERQTRVKLADIIALWTTSGGLTAEEAYRRASELIAVAVGPDDELLGVSTAYIDRSDRLQLDLWHVRVLVADNARLVNVARKLLNVGRDILYERYTSGADTRARGILIEVENAGVNRHMTVARWPTTGYEYVGEDNRGRHLRVIYFPGSELF